MIDGLDNVLNHLEKANGNNPSQNLGTMTSKSNVAAPRVPSPKPQKVSSQSIQRLWRHMQLSPAEATLLKAELPKTLTSEATAAAEQELQRLRRLRRAAPPDRPVDAAASSFSTNLDRLIQAAGDKVTWLKKGRAAADIAKSIVAEFVDRRYTPPENLKGVFGKMFKWHAVGAAPKSFLQLGTDAGEGSQPVIASDPITVFKNQLLLETNLEREASSLLDIEDKFELAEEISEVIMLHYSEHNATVSSGDTASDLKRFHRAAAEIVAAYEGSGTLLSVLENMIRLRCK